MAAEKSKNNPIQDLLNVMGAVAEMSLVFYRSVIGAGATSDEAFRITQAYIGAALYGNTTQNQPPKPPDP